MVTPFTRIVIVLSFLRTAIGIQQTPPNPVLIGLALFLTGFVMAPTLRDRLARRHRAADGRARSTETEALERAVAPFHAFMTRQVREQDLALFLDIAQDAPPTEPRGRRRCAC